MSEETNETAEEIAETTAETTSTEESQSGSLLSQTEVDTETKEESDDKSPEESADKDDAEAKDGEEAKPIEYEAFKLPEGLEIDEALHGEFIELAKSSKLTQEQAQGMIDLRVKQQAQETAAMDKQISDWEAQVTSDPNHKVMLADAQKALMHYADGDEDVIAIFNEHSMGSNPKILQFLARAAAPLKEGSFITGDSPPPPKVSLAEQVYGNK